MTVLTLIIAAWFMGSSAANESDHRVVSQIALWTLCAIFIIAALVKSIWYQDDDLPE